MASISTDAKGNRRILFVAADGKRRPVRVGKAPLKDVQILKTRIQALNTARIMGHAPDNATAAWLADLDQVMVDKLAAVGLCEPRRSANLKEFLDGYIGKRSDVKGSTATVYGHTRRCLVEFFGATKALRDITKGDADDWRLWLADNQGLADNTVRRRSGIAKQFFRAAQRAKLITENPFGDLVAAVRSNQSRFYFITREEATAVLSKCPDAQWRLLFALSRYGGLRCPSEHLGLTWGDIDWDRGRMTVRSPKTEHHEGGESRVVPIFPELLPYLEAVYDEAPEGSEHVITRYRDSTANLRTLLQKIIGRAGLKPWPKLWQNLRSTRETELCETFPIHVVCKWIGNSVAVAKKHYLQVTDEHYEAARKQAQYTAVSPREAPCQESTTPVIPEEYGILRECTTVHVGGEGLEPPTSSV